ncbi:MAG: hypothetical protein SFU91_03570 [Chloroherpetonaceae bacterium]|nr:hypothetical protein [Chloroherpetonaceae bacterium]
MKYKSIFYFTNHQIKILVLTLSIFTVNDVIYGQTQCIPLLIETITFKGKNNKEILIGEITAININSKGMIALADSKTKKVFLLNKNGELINEISDQEIDAIDPGRGKLFAPERIIINKDDDIYVQSPINHLGYLYRFNSNLKFIEKYEYSNINNGHSFIFNQKGDLFSYIISDSEKPLLLIQGKQIVEKKIALDDEFKNISRRRPIQNAHALEENGNIIVGFSGSHKIHVYDKNGTKLYIVDNKPKEFIEPVKDYPDKITTHKDFQEIARNQSSWMMGIYLIDKNALLRHFVNKEGEYYDVIDLKGKTICETKILTERFLFAKNGYVYSEFRQTNGNREVNPQINMYKVKRK